MKHIILAVCLFSLGCSNNSNHSFIDEIPCNVMSYKDDISEYLDLISVKIADGNMIVLTSSKNNTNFSKESNEKYHVINILKDSLRYSFPSKVGSYFKERYDYSNGKVAYLTNHFSKQEILYFGKNKGYDENYTINSPTAISVSDFYIDNENLYFEGNMYGVSIINLNDNNIISKKNYNVVQNYQYSKLSFPLMAVNLQTGHWLNEKTFVNYAIENEDMRIIWADTFKSEYRTIRHEPNPGYDFVSVLNYTDKFVVFCEGDIYALNKENGDVIWRAHINASTAKLMMYQNKFIVCYLEEGLAKIRLFSYNTGKHIWTHEEKNKTEILNFYMLGDKIIFQIEKKIKIIDINEGVVKYSYAAIKNDISLNQLKDYRTGIYYIIDKQEGKLYW